MKHILAGSLLAATCLGTQAGETKDLGYFTSGSLYNICSEPIKESDCIMFIIGTLQGMDAQAYLDQSQDQCIPLDDKTNGDLKNIVTGYLAANKQLAAEPAATSVILALGTDECKAKLMPPR